jgi:uncharacterized protein YjiS (DUF1127 family)
MGIGGVLQSLVQAPAAANSLSPWLSLSAAIAAVPSVQRQVSAVTGFPVSEIVAQPHISTFATQQGGSILPTAGRRGRPERRRHLLSGTRQITRSAAAAERKIAQEARKLETTGEPTVRPKESAMAMNHCPKLGPSAVEPETRRAHSRWLAAKGRRLHAAIVAHVRRRRGIRELQALDDRALADIGLRRCEIERAVRFRPGPLGTVMIGGKDQALTWQRR